MALTPDTSVQYLAALERRAALYQETEYPHGGRSLYHFPELSGFKPPHPIDRVSTRRLLSAGWW